MYLELLSRIALTLAALASLIAWRKADIALRCLLALLVISCIDEWFNHYLVCQYYCYESAGMQGVADSYKFAKRAMSHFFSMFELALMWVSFSYVVWRRPPRIILISGIGASIAAGIVNMRFFQPLTEYNTIMLQFECLTIIIMSLVVLGGYIQIDMPESPFSNIHFMMWATNLTWWTLTFFFWVFVNYYERRNPSVYSVLTKRSNCEFHTIVLRDSHFTLSVPKRQIV